MVEPYLLAIIAKKGFNLPNASGDTTKVQNAARLEKAELASAVEEIKKRFHTGISAGHAPHPENLEYYETDTLDLTSIYDESAIVIENQRHLNPANDSWSPAGLLLEDFKVYVDKICGSVHHEINVIVTSSSGRMFAHVTNTTDLRLFSSGITLYPRKKISGNRKPAKYNHRHLSKKNLLPRQSS